MRKDDERVAADVLWRAARQIERSIEAVAIQRMIADGRINAGAIERAKSLLLKEMEKCAS